MQATLLGLGIAIILALVAALVGPYFVDWSDYRSVFETEVSRLAGLPVRVKGRIDARILPVPSVVLRDVEAGGSAESGRLKVREAAVELALGPLLRGEWRASELRLVQPDFALRLDQQGRVEWPGAAPGLDPDSLSIDRLAVEDGHVVLSDQASASSLALDKLWFNGDVRSLAGPIKGEGGFVSATERYGYRLAVGRIGEDGIKLRLNVDPSDRLLTVEADGMLRLERGLPRFEGALAFGRPAGVALGRGRAVSSDAWRASSKVKLTPSGGLLEQIEVQYGGDDRPIKLTGTAQVKFGKGARFDGVMSARQIDLDRAFVLPEGTRRVPAAVLRRAGDAFGGLLTPPIPVRLGIGIDSVTLAGATLQNLRGDLASDGEGWNVENFEFRAPGMTQVHASGRMAFMGEAARFTGPAVVESSDPRALVGWLEARADALPAQTGPLRASGDLALGSDRIAVERLNAEVDRKTVTGRLAYSWAGSDHPARLDAALTATELDIDQAVGFTRAALAGATLDAPGEAALAVDIGVATIGGVEAKQARAKLNFDANGLVLERVAVADLGGASLDLNGRIEQLTTAPRGALTLEIEGKSLDGVATALGRYLPQTVATAHAIVPRLAPAKLSALLSVENAENGGGSRAELVVSGRAGPARINLTADATGDPANIAAADINLNGRLYGDDGAALVALLGLDRAVAVDKRAASLSVAASGRLNDLHVESRLAAARLEATAKGGLRLVGDEAFTGAVDLKLAAADAFVLRRALAAGDRPVPVTVRTSLAIKSGALSFDNISGVVAGSAVSGRLGVTLEQPIRLDGRLETDALDFTALAGAALGMPPRSAARAEGGWATDPFVPGAFADLSGQVAFEARRAAFSPSLAAQDLHGLVRFGSGEVSFEDVEGSLGGGRLLGQLGLRSAPEGIVARGRLALTDADAGAVLSGGPRPPLAGRLGLQVEAEGTGLSPATLMGSLRGAGTVTMEAAQISGLDPKAFDIVIGAVDRGLTIDGAKVRDMTEAGLQAGRLSVPRVDGAFSIAAGQARWSNVVAHGDGADLNVSGLIDLSESTLDTRLTVSGPSSGGSAGAADRPEVFVALKGPLAAPKRSLDASAFTGWLTLRAVEHQSKRLEVLQSEHNEATVGTTPPASAPVPPAETPAQAPPASARATPPDAAEPQAAEPQPAEPTAPPAPPPAAKARRALAPAVPPAAAAPPLPPPIEIRPSPEPRANPSGPHRPSRTSAPNGAAKPRASDAARPPADVPPPAARRSVLDQLFGPQR